MNLHETSMAAEVLRPGDDGYDDAARAFFATGRPAWWSGPRDPDEVAAALAPRRTPRPGGVRALRRAQPARAQHQHRRDGDRPGAPGRVEVLDADRRLVRVGGGATWGQVSAALDPHGWALTAGDTADVGVGGLTLGGGIGWMVRRYGLADRQPGRAPGW